MITPALRSELQQLARNALGESFRLERIEPVSGGDINTTLQLQGGSDRVFVKLRPAADADMFAAEADGLAALARCGELRVPRVLALGEADGQAALLLEWLDLQPLNGEAAGRRAGEAVAALHRLAGERYGWRRPNYLGSTPQSNTPHDNWARFFVAERLQPQLALAARRGFKGELQHHGEKIAERAAALFLEYRPTPSLLHGDLWHGNIGMLADGAPALFDPAVHHGDRESDLAMSELFGGFPLSFYSAYRAAWPLDMNYERRKPLYTLYHVLNHLNLFGRGYLAQAERLAARLSRELSL